MVFYFTCSDSRYTIYMGRDKFENEHLIAHGWPEDLWFHVHGHSSAHVYLRLPKGDEWTAIPDEVVHECAQLTKANSIEGSKLSHVPVVYTPWANLRKEENMADGQVGFHDRKQIKMTVVEHRINAIVNRLNKTKTEAHNNPRELADLRRARDEQEAAEAKAASRQMWKERKVEEDQRRADEAERQAAAIDAEAKTLESMYAMDRALDAAMHASSVQQDRALQARRAQLSARSEETRASEEAALIGGLFSSAVVDKSGWKKKGKSGKAALANGMEESAAGDDGVDGHGRGGGPSVATDFDDNLWGAEDDEDAAFWASFGGVGGGAGGGGGASYAGAGVVRLKRGEKLGELGEEAAAVQAARKTADEMEKLTRVAHDRKDEAERKAAAAKHARDEKAKAAEVELARKRGEQQAKHAGAQSVVSSGLVVANSSLDAQRADGTIEATLEQNRSTQDEELMVLEAIFAEALVKEEAEDSGHAAYALELTGETASKAEARLRLRVRYLPEYPSHLPPACELCLLADGADEANTGGMVLTEDDAAAAVSSLQAMFFEARAETAAADEPAEGIVHLWAEWLREEWLPLR